MIINELISQYRKILKSPWDSAKTIIKYMEDNGFKKIGSGLFSIVFAKPNSNFVVKIGYKKIKDDGYLDYIHYLKTHQKNSHYPKIGKLRYYNKNDILFYIIPIEKLYPADLSNEQKNIIDKFIMEPNSNVKNKIISLFGEEFTKALYNLIELTPYLDIMAGENIMKRKDGTLVLSDPIGFGLH